MLSKSSPFCIVIDCCDFAIDLPSLCRLLRAKDLSHIVYQKPFCFSVSSFKFLMNSVNQIPIFLLTLPQIVKYTKINQI